MARLFISLALALLAGAACAESFGRFGYVESAQVSGFKLDRKGFRVNNPKADTFVFDNSSTIWKPLATNDKAQVVGLSGVALAPYKLKIDLLAPGFSLYFRHGFRFKVSSISAPFLTWPEGSIDANTAPTAPAKWVLVSFRDNQPPVLLGFPGKPGDVEVVGRSGDWQIRSPKDYEGWVRVSAPLGLRGYATTDAHELGQLTALVKPHVDAFAADAPVLKETAVSDDATSVTATWSLSKAGAVVPAAAFFAPVGGYNVTVVSKTRKLPYWTEDGPYVLTDEPQLTMRFTIKRIPTGRCLSIGPPSADVLATASPVDVPSVTEVALSNLVASRDDLMKSLAQETMEGYMNELDLHEEPFSGQRLPYSPDGAGMDLAAAHALLMQSTLSTVKATSEPNSLLTSLSWRRDWFSWELVGADRALARRASALAALAGALCPEPERRLEACLFQAGLSAERGRAIWQRRNKLIQAEPKLLEVLEPLRGELFYLFGAPRTPGFGATLVSPVRVYSDQPLVLEKREDKLVLKFTAINMDDHFLTLASAFPLEVTQLTNATDAALMEALGFSIIRVKPKKADITELQLTVPSWADPLPAYVAPPRFAEVPR